ncbi:serine hydrolase [Dactylosporangium vinaceum]|uniref:Serine hydrolase n=1 Tax=Dactylosporangium vinaceum TaxID=53362 RepID=A0ABV5MIY9_9ACTN|nr:serine hydrolase [Dactylosporangium vinaceum]
MSAPPAVTRIRRAYARAKAAAGGAWHARITIGDRVVVSDSDDEPVPGYSIQKLFVAAAVLSRVPLDRRVRLRSTDVLGGSGLYHLQPVHGDELTAAGILTALLLVSDNTAVRLCGRLLPAAEINDTLASLGFARTRVAPTPDPARFFLGDTTARETHDLLTRLAAGTLLDPAGTAFVLAVLRSPTGYHDGIRHDLSGPARTRVATKHGADHDTRGAARHEAGIVFARNESPAAVYALFAHTLSGADDYGPTHPAARAHAALGRAMWAATREPEPPD